MGTTTRHSRGTSGGEAGFGLIEVVISAAILLMVTVGTLALIDGSQRISTRNSARTVAGNLAEQDQERMRSTPVSTLAGPVAGGRLGSTSTATKSVAGIPYTVDSKAEWIRDKTGALPSCNDPDGVAEYLRITSTVTPQRSAGGLAPITLTSLLAPGVGSFGPHTGTLSIQLLNRTGAPLQGITVNITGPQNASQPTNAAGCAVFNYVPSGAYTATFAKPLYVDIMGNPTGDVSATVSDNSVTTQTASYDQEGALNVRVRTTESGNPASTTRGVTVVNARMNVGAAGGKRTFPAPGTTSANIVAATDLFPFTDGYGAYSGTCSANEPSQYGGTLASVPALGAGSTLTVDVDQPELDVNVKNSSNVNVANANLVAFPSDPGCDATLAYRFASRTNSSGISKQGLPYGKYNLCVDNNANKRQFFSATNTNKNGTSLNVKLTALVNGTC